MGVPKFFRYISERYPCLSEIISEHQISDFDNLYLDMNGIIHSCSHPDDSNPHFRITEEKIFSDIFHYISYLFQLIRPKKVFYMAIDGVAPRAKMNQQRGRRFRTAKDASLSEMKAKEKGEKLPEGKRFDSNCITPGTVFMARLHEQLRYFIKQKISTDSLWGKCRIVLSGHETPGEGEHKIMEYIRFLKTQPDHDPNTRHCLYGLDADLIMLGLCIHEPNFSLLREEVKFGKHAQKAMTPNEANFFLLHLPLLKDYLEQEFLPVKDKISFEYDIEKIIDDWVLMGFLVGNDFIPPLPHLHIHTNALPLLYETYKKVIIHLDGYINEGGVLNLQRFEKFMKELSNLDRESFQDTYADLKYFESKTGRCLGAQERKNYKSHVPDDNETFGNLENFTDEWKPQSDDLKKLIQATDALADPDDPEWEDAESDEEGGSGSSDEDVLFNQEFKLHRHDYYKTKLDYENVTPEVLQSQAECYVRAIQWVLHYYYQGCVSWSWFYPHHYAPFITDIVDFKNMDLSYDIGIPFKPFEQLLAVLPAASKELLPEPFHFLMIDEKSPIFSYYPENFETDLNGKRNEWEAVVLIPFIDEANLLNAMEPYYKCLTEDELKRNSHGPILIYDYTAQDLGQCIAPEYFPTILSCHARETQVFRKELEIPPDKVIRGPLPNPVRGVYFPGMPTLKTLSFTSHFTNVQIKVFDHPSRNESCILRIAPNAEEESSIEDIAGKLLGKIVWVGWPHLQRAKVQHVSNADLVIRYVPEKKLALLEDDEVKFVIKENSNQSKISNFEVDKRTIIDHHARRLGVELDDIKVVVHAVSLKGFNHVFGTDGTIIDCVNWCSVPSPYPLQAVLPNLEVSPIFSTRNLTIDEVLAKGEKVFLKANPYYGCHAEILDSSSFLQTGRIKVSVFVEPEPILTPLTAECSYMYMSCHNAAARCGISSLLLSRLTGCTFVSKSDNPEGRNGVNIGLHIKYSKKNEEVAGYTRRVNMKWTYSQRCVDLVREYIDKYPDLFEKWERKVNQDRFTLKDLFPDEDGESKLEELSKWLENHPYKKSSIRSCDSEFLEPEEMVEINDKITSQSQELQQQRKTVVVQVKPHVLFKPDFQGGKFPPDPNACDFRLFDRVVNVNSRSVVPVGLKGTIIGISQSKLYADTVNLSDKLNTEPVYHILFDDPFVGGSSGDGITDTRLYKMQGSSLLNITLGRGNTPETGKGMANVKLPENGHSAVHNLKNLRKGNGHNSAFANYTSPSKSLDGNKSSNINSPSHLNQESQRPTLQILKNIPAVNDEQSNMLKSMLNININSSSPQKPAHPTPPSSIPMPSWIFNSPQSRPPTQQSGFSHHQSGPLPHQPMSLPLQPMQPPLQSMHSPLQSMHSPLQSMHSPLQSMHSPLQSMQPSLQSMQSPPKPMQPPLQSMHSPLQSMPPSLQSMHSPHKPMQPPLQSMHSPLQSILSPHQTMPPLHQTMPPPHQSMMLPHQSMPPPHQSIPFGRQPYPVTGYNNYANAPPQQHFNVPQNMSNPNVANQLLMNSYPLQTPEDLKLPFPNKFLDQNFTAPNNNGGGFGVDGIQGSKGNSVPSQFIPLQAVRQRCTAPPLGSNKPYRKSTGDKNNMGTSVLSLPQEMENKAQQATQSVPLSQAAQVCSTEIQSSEKKPMKQKKSRLAANFGNFPQ